MKGRPILPAYTDTGAWNVACPHCDAPAGQPCMKADGRISRVPCVDRITAADLAPTVGLTPAVDFSEPRRQKEVDR